MEAIILCGISYLFTGCGIFKFTISGTVVDEDEEPLVGANILIKDTNRGTSTERDGSFSIMVRKGEILVFSFIQYENIEYKVTGSEKKNIKITLKETSEHDDHVEWEERD